MKCANRTRNVFQRELAKISELRIQPTNQSVASDCGNNDAARVGDAFKPARDIHAITKDVAVFNYDVADIDSNTKLETLILRDRDIALPNATLNIECAESGVNDACELDQEPISSRLDDPSPVLGHLGIENFPPAGQ